MDMQFIERPWAVRNCSKKLGVRVLAAVAVVSGMAFAGFAIAEAPSANYSLLCGGCNLGSPLPTSSTKAAILNYMVTSAPVKPISGDTITVCNGTACVKYTLDDSGNYMGGAPINQVTNPPGSGGGGGGNGGGGGGAGGGANLPGGCIGNCGIVTVGSK